MADAQLVWLPSSKLNAEQMLKFKRMAMKPYQRPDRAHESALCLLFRCGYNVEEAMAVWSQGHYQVRDPIRHYRRSCPGSRLPRAVPDGHVSGHPMQTSRMHRRMPWSLAPLD